MCKNVMRFKKIYINYQAFHKKQSCPELKTKLQVILSVVW